MDPWDFIRWRIGRKIQERLDLPGQSASSFIRSLVYRLCEEDVMGSNLYADPIMREAVLLAARYQNRLGSYKGHRQQPAKSSHAPAPGKMAPPARPRSRLQSDAARAAEEVRRARRASLAVRPSTYQGVNAFRAQMQARTAGKEKEPEG